MALQTVNWFSTALLSCAAKCEASPPPVVLCIANGLVLPQVCPQSAETYVGNFIEATVTRVLQQVSAVCGKQFRYTFEYDDVQLLDPSTLLTCEDVLGAFCRGCLSDYIDVKAGAASYIRIDPSGDVFFVNQYGCEYFITNNP